MNIEYIRSGLRGASIFLAWVAIIALVARYGFKVKATGHQVAIGLATPVVVALLLGAYWMFVTRSEHTTLLDAPIELGAVLAMVLPLEKPVRRTTQAVLINVTVADAAESVAAPAGPKDAGRLIKLRDGRLIDLQVTCLSSGGKEYGSRIRSWSGNTFHMSVLDLPRSQNITRLRLSASGPVRIERIVWSSTWLK